MSGRRRTGHVELSEGSFMLWELPLVKKAESAHAEGEDRRDGWRSGEKGGCMEDCPVATKGGSQVDFLGERRRKAYAVRGSGGSLRYCVKRERKGRVELVCGFGLKDEGY